MWKQKSLDVGEPQKISHSRKQARKRLRRMSNHALQEWAEMTLNDFLQTFRQAQDDSRHTPDLYEIAALLYETTREMDYRHDHN